MRKHRLAALMVVLASVVAACGASADVGGSIEGTWELTSGTFQGQPVSIVDGYPVTLTIEEDGLGGRAACNQYFGDYSITGSTISITGLGQTEMGCDGPVMDSESQYLSGLASISGLVLDDDVLTLEGDDIELVFKAQPPVPTADLQGTVWVLEGLVDGDAVSSTLGDRATLELFSDGSVLGSTGCRDFNGQYTIRGAEVVFTIFNVEGECTPDVEAQDSQVVSVLGDGFTATVDEQTLTASSMGA